MLARCSLRIGLLSLVLLALTGAALARPTPEEVADDAMSAIGQAVSLVEQDAAALQTRAASTYAELALIPNETKRVKRIEKTGMKFMKQTDKARAKAMKKIDKIAIKAAKRIAKLGGDPALIVEIEGQRVTAQAECNAALDEMWAAIAAMQEDALGG